MTCYQNWNKILFTCKNINYYFGITLKNKNAYNKNKIDFANKILVEKWLH